MSELTFYTYFKVESEYLKVLDLRGEPKFDCDRQMTSDDYDWEVPG